MAAAANQITDHPCVFVLILCAEFFCFKFYAAVRLIVIGFSVDREEFFDPRASRQIQLLILFLVRDDRNIQINISNLTRLKTNIKKMLSVTAESDRQNIQALFVFSHIFIQRMTEEMTLDIKQRIPLAFCIEIRLNIREDPFFF